MMKTDGFLSVGNMKAEKIEHMLEEAVCLEERCMKDPELAKVYSDVKFYRVIQELEEWLGYARQIESFEAVFQ